MRLEEKPDGRMYSRVLRRIVAIILTIPRNRTLTLSELATLVHEKKLPQFHLQRFDRQVSPERIRDYIRYLRDLTVLQETTEGLSTQFTIPRAAAECAQVFSDLALEHLSKLMQVSPAEVVDKLLASRKRLLQQQQIPVLDTVASDQNITSGRDRELFRWSLFLYADGEASRLDIHRYPVLTTKGHDRI
jgi:hypothetical protein